MNSKVLLIIMDGWGVAAPSNRNAITLANTPNYNSLLSKSIYTELLASGEAVGLPEGQMGNSEVGHLNLGAPTTAYCLINGSIFTTSKLERRNVASAGKS